ncbi:MAG: fibrobacter succinogenes major paralogous domain-containing protein, partial [Chitinophagaceae bacterium]|nr:fibrobacter succinogenes major paralogous domain-containing protein [Chitinophagaceae bacterium]
MTTTQRDAILSPTTGLVIFNTTTDCLEFKTSTVWVSLTTSNSVNYSSILIGTQNWMDKNLNVSTYQNGDIIQYVSDPAAWAALTTGAWCYYNNDPANNAIYGKLYNWYAVNDLRGLAPKGWHIPTDAEWTTLSTTLGGDAIAGW